MWLTGAAVGSARISMDAGGLLGAAAGLGPHAATAVQRVTPAALRLAANAHRSSGGGGGGGGGGFAATHQAESDAAAAVTASVFLAVPDRPEDCGGAGAPATPAIAGSGGLEHVLPIPGDGSPGGGKSPRGARSPRAAFGRDASRHTGCGDGFADGLAAGDDGGSDAGCGEADGATHIAKRAASHTSSHGHHAAFGLGSAADTASTASAAVARSRSRPGSRPGSGSGAGSGATDVAMGHPDAAAAAAAAGSSSPPSAGRSSPAPAEPPTCRLSMKLHSGHVEQIQPGAVAALARLLLPAGWALTNLAVRRGCIELLLEYTRVPAADESGDSGDAAGGGAGASEVGASGGAAEVRPGTPYPATQALAAAALAAALGMPPQQQPPQQQEGDLPAHQLEALLACLQQQGLVDPALEPAVTVQVNHQLQCVRWQPGPPAAPSAPAPAEDTSSPQPHHPQSPFARAAGGAADAGGGTWRCGDVAVYCGAPSVALVVEPCCIALPCTTAPATAAAEATAASAPGSVGTAGGGGNGAGAATAAGVAGARHGGAGRSRSRGGGRDYGAGEGEGEGEAVLLYVGIPRTGTHCCTVRGQGGFLPATEVCRLPALDLLPASGTGGGVGAGGARVSLPQVLTLASSPAAAVASPQAAPPLPVPTAAATGLLLRRLLGGAAARAPAPAARVDLRCAAAVAAAVGCGGQVVVLSLPAAALPRAGGGGSGALLQVECRVPAEECTWSSALEEDLAGSGNSVSAATQPVAAGASGAAPAAALGDAAAGGDAAPASGSSSGSGSFLPRSSDPFSAAAPVLVLRSACCGAAARGTGSACASCQRRAAVDAAGARATVPWAGAWSADEVMGVSQELLELRRRFAFGMPASLPSSGGFSGGFGGGGGDLRGAGLTPAAAGTATAEFLSDLGLLLDAVAATAAEAAAAARDGGGSADDAAAAATHEYEFPSFAQQLRAVMLEQLGAAAAGAAAAPATALREHLGDTAVTLLAGCGELRLPRAARLVLALAAALQLGGGAAAADTDDDGVEELLAAAADGDAGLAARLRALLHMREAPPLPEVLQAPLSYASPAVSSSSSSARLRVSGGIAHSGGAVSATALDPASAVAALAGLPLPVRPSSRVALRVDQDVFHSHLHAHLQPLLHPQPQPQPLELRGWGDVVAAATIFNGGGGGDELLAAADAPRAHVYEQLSSSHQLPYAPQYDTAALPAAAAGAASGVHGTVTPVTPAPPDVAAIPGFSSDSGVASQRAPARGHSPAPAGGTVYQRFGDPFLEASTCGAFSAFRVAHFGPQHEHEGLEAAGSAVCSGGASGSVEVLSGGAGVMVGGGPRPVPHRVVESPRAQGAVGEAAAAMLMPAPSLVGCSLSAAASLEMGRADPQQQPQQQQAREADQGADQGPGAPHCCRLVAAIAAVCSGRLTRAGLSLNGAVSTGAPEQPSTPIPDPSPLRQRQTTGELTARSAAPSCASSSSSTSRLLAAASGTLSATTGGRAAAATTGTGTTPELPLAPPPAPYTPHALARALLLGFPSAATERAFWDHTASEVGRSALTAYATLLALTALLAAVRAVCGGGVASGVAAACYGGQAVLVAAAVAGGAGRAQVKHVVAAAMLRAACGAALVRWVAASGAAVPAALVPLWGSGAQWVTEWLAQPVAEQLPLRLHLPLLLVLGPWTAPLLGATTWLHALG
ncbi:hypothetical protein HXX76_004347 [Chlamydomonas incerta]|uniref:Uncharacterized protein n=1 Tax=Chlamydomonas incerta TaxID=51695 RepID=A0A835TK09_CHLIN|nr:hypothetical protein HXX76_004347 [Chlamydomonas incerta]|eukprot:KAG2440235.1 hypothetical protein HXX76_004347 [Chlamydomonas incerta]